MTQILIKRSATASKVPLTTDLALGELAINTYDGKLFTKKNNGADAIVEIGANTFTGDVTGSGNGNVALTLTNSGVAAGTYTKVTVDAKGRVTSATNMTNSDIISSIGFTPEDISKKNTANGYAGLGADGKLPSGLLPAIAITDTFTAGSDAAMLALTAQRGDIVVRTDLSRTFILATDDPTVMANWQEILGPVGSSSVYTVNGKTGTVTITTSDITEGTNLYYTDARAIAAPLTGFAVGSNSSIVSTDTILAAFGKVQAQLNAKATAGANSNITSLSGLTTALSISQGGTGATTAAAAKVNLVLDRVENKSSADIRNEISSSNVTTALGYTPAYTGLSIVNNASNGPWVPFANPMIGGKCLYEDEEFAAGTNGVVYYNNASSTATVVTRQADSTAPNASGYVLKIAYDGTGASPGLSGFIQSIASAQNKIFVQRFRAKIPVGYSVVDSQNSIGDDGQTYWITSKNGTGKYEDYIRVTHCGSTGSFQGGGHVYLSGPAGAVTWYLSSCTTYDVTARQKIWNSSNLPVSVTPTSQSAVIRNANGGTPYVFLDRSGTTSTGILWYNQGNNAWTQYMANAGSTNNGPKGNLTAPNGSLVTAWALRSFIENVTGYGWTFESNTINSTTPTVVAEISSVDGSAKFGGAVTAPAFKGTLGNSSNANVALNMGSTGWTMNNGEANILGEIKDGSASGDSRLMIYSNAGKANVYVDGDIYANNGASKVWHTGNMVATIGSDGYSLNWSGSDMNAMTATGFYRGANLVNAPFGNSGWWFVTVEGHDSGGNWVTQKAVAYGSGNTANEIYNRTKFNGTWTAWVQVTDGAYGTQYTIKRRRASYTSATNTSINNITAPETGFDYDTAGANVSGPFIHFGGLGGYGDYGCQLVAAYNGGGYVLKFRTKNDDTNPTWNGWRNILHDSNFNNYAPTLTGTGASGTWTIGITGSAATLMINGVGTAFNWSGQSGQPPWVWGGSTTGNMYVYNPSNFNVAGAVLLNGPAKTNGTDGWFRSTGTCGWFNETYGVGVYSTESGNVRTYNNASFITSSTVYAGQFSGPGTALTGTASSLTAGNATSISAATGIGYVWTGQQSFQSNMNTAGGSAPPLVAYSTGGNGAIMSFLRNGYYAVNMGLDSDNIFRIGGWSAPANLMQLDMSGNFTALGNVTAYSDERLKTNWREIAPGFVNEWANIKYGIYDRLDNGKTQVGLSAQSVQKILPDAVEENSDGILSLNYGAASAVATVELAKEIASLKETVRQQAAMIKLLMEKVGY